MLLDRVRLSARGRQRPPRVRLLRLVSGLALVAASLWSGAATAVTPAVAAATCTGWASNSVPPETIRVLRTSGPASGTVQVVPFRAYVYTVIAAEWSPGPASAVRAGAIAVKQYAWYWTIVWRGKSAADGSCYDVVDTTTDQIYKPETRAPVQSLIDAVDSTWSISLRKDGRLFPGGYRTGTVAECTADAAGRILYQKSLYACAKAGMTVDQLLHRYLDPVEIVLPGVGDSTGDGLGDVVVVTPGGELTNVRLYASGRVDPPATSVAAILGVPVALPIAPAQTVFRQLADVTGDHLDDMLILQRVGDSQYQVWVAPSTGDAFDPPQLWWDSLGAAVPIAPGALVRFVAGDFTGDGLADAGLLVAGSPVPAPTPNPLPTPTPGPTPTPSATPIATAVIGAPVTGAVPSATPAPTASAPSSPGVSPAASPAPGGPVTPPGLVPGATMWVLAGTGSALGPATPAWSGPLELNGTKVFAGDVDGNGRADLVIQMDMIRQPTPATGLRYAVLRTGAPDGSAPEPWLDVADLAAAGAKTVLADINGDGRSDVVVDRAVGLAGSQMLGLMSTGSAFVQRILWTNTGSFRWRASRLASADVDGDGRGDIVVLYNLGAAGSRLFRFLSTGSKLRSSGATTDPGLPWAGAAPY